MRRKGYERLAFREHFVKVMQGRETSLADLIEADRSDDSFRYKCVDVEQSWQAIPSPTDVVHMSLCARGGKAPGENLIVGKVHNRFADRIGMMYYPFALKTFVRVHPP